VSAALDRALACAQTACELAVLSGFEDAHAELQRGAVALRQAMGAAAAPETRAASKRALRLLSALATAVEEAA
jgi:hypothetical protein